MKMRLKVLFFMFITLIAASLNAATLIFNDGFESGNLGKHRPQLATPPAASFTVVNDPVASGAYAGRFDLPFVSVNSDNYRSETVMRNGEGNFAFNQEYWISFKFRYEDWAKDSSVEMAPFQIHLRPSSWEAACQLGSAWSNAPFYMWSANDYVAFNTYGGKTRWRAPIQKKTWMAVTVRFIPSYNSNGLIEAWLNGAKIASVSGINQAEKDACGSPMKPPYLKMGTYKWDWKAGRPATQATQRTLLIDDIKIAKGLDGYELVTLAMAPDTAPPKITNVKAQISYPQTVILWDTDEDSNSRVDYGKTRDYGQTVNKQESVTLHSIPITVERGETYYYRIRSADTSGNIAMREDFTFSVTPPPDETAPVVSGITETVTDTTATITWATDEDTTGRVNYGGSPTYTSGTPFTQAGKAHTVTLTGLTPSTVVHYQVSAKDAAGNITNSEDRTFTTKATPLVVNNVTVQFAATSAVVTWETNKPISGGKVLSRIACSTAPFVETGEADSTPTTSHTAMVTGLLPLTAYTLSVNVTDEDGTVKTVSVPAGSTSGEQP